MNPNRYEQPKKRIFSEDAKAERAWFLGYLGTIAEKVLNGELVAQVDWDLVWVISGPEIGITDEAEDKKQNQTKERLEKGFELIKEITAKRIGKEVSHTTIDDIRQSGPLLYYNGSNDQNNALRESINSGVIVEKYGIPAEKMRVTENTTIENTAEQFEDFPRDLQMQSRKIILVSSLYHCPRIAKYIEKMSREKDNPALREQMIIYPANSEMLRIGRGVGEGKKIIDYFSDIYMSKR